MSRKPRDIKDGYCYHITTCCNNREFRLTRHECRQLFLYALHERGWCQVSKSPKAYELEEISLETILYKELERL